MSSSARIGPMTAALVSGRPDIDRDALVAYRLERIRRQMRSAGVELSVLVNPVSLRYATDYRDYAAFQAHIPIYYAFVPIEGPVTLHGARADAHGVYDRLRPARGISYFDAGSNLQDEARAFALDVVDFMREHRLHDRRVAVEHVNPSLTQALLQQGLEVLDAVGLMELARSVKSELELQCMRWSIAVAEEGISRMRECLAPGITENQLWSVLAATNVANGGDWLEGRMLCSGPRTNPWLQEATSRIIAHGDLVAFDTDLIGPFGYCADISRTWRCGDDEPTPRQRDLYQRAAAEVEHNMALIRPGVTFRELSNAAFRQEERFLDNRYVCLAHGIGMCDEYPKIHHRQDWPLLGYDGVIEQDMVLCVESYVGAVGGAEGVKLEQQVRVTESGVELLSHSPLEEEWLR